MSQAGTNGREIDLSILICPLRSTLWHAVRIGNLIVIVVDIRSIQPLRRTFPESVCIVWASTLAEPRDNLFLVGFFVGVIFVRAILNSRDFRFTIHEDAERVLSFSLPFAIEALFLDLLGILRLIVALCVKDELPLQHQLVLFFDQKWLFWKW